MQNMISIVVGLLVLIFLLYRQRKIRKVRKDVNYKLPLILLILGIANFKGYVATKPLSVNSLLVLIFSLLFLAVGMGAIRAATVKIWVKDGVIFRQGTWLTISLWIVSAGLHMFVDFFGHTGESSLLIYYAVTLFIQSLVVQYRTKSKFSNVYNSIRTNE